MWCRTVLPTQDSWFMSGLPVDYHPLVPFCYDINWIAWDDKIMMCPSQRKLQCACKHPVRSARSVGRRPVCFFRLSSSTHLVSEDSLSQPPKGHVDWEMDLISSDLYRFIMSIFAGSSICHIAAELGALCPSQKRWYCSIEVGKLLDFFPTHRSFSGTWRVRLLSCSWFASFYVCRFISAFPTFPKILACEFTINT